MTTLIITAIWNALMLTCDIYILTHVHLSVKKYLVFFLSFSALFFMQLYFSFSLMLLIALSLNSVLLVKFTGKLYAVFYVPLGYIINCILGNLISFAANMAWDFTIQELNADTLYIVIFISCAILLLPRPLSGQAIASEISD